MNKQTTLLRLTTTAIMAMLLSATTVQAVGYDNTVSVKVLNGINGQVDIGEFEFTNDTTIGEREIEATGGYFVDVLQEPVSVYGFAVSINSHVYPYTYREAWNASFISAEEWDGGHAIGFGGPGGLLTTDIAEFASSLFGEDSYINIYYNVEGSNITEGSDTDQPFPTIADEAEFFFGEGFLASEFVAFTVNGEIIDQSLQNNQPVPEPSTVLLFGTGLVGLLAHTIRKKAQPIA